MISSKRFLTIYRESVYVWIETQENQDEDNWITIKRLKIFFLPVWIPDNARTLNIYIGCGGRICYLNFNAYIVNFLWMVSTTRKRCLFDEDNKVRDFTGLPWSVTIVRICVKRNRKVICLKNKEWFGTGGKMKHSKCYF